MNVCALSVLWLSSLAELPHSPVQLDEKIERGNYWHRFHSCVQSNEWLSSNVQTLFLSTALNFLGCAENFNQSDSFSISLEESIRVQAQQVHEKRFFWGLKYL